MLGLLVRFFGGRGVQFLTVLWLGGFCAAAQAQQSPPPPAEPELAPGGRTYSREDFRRQQQQRFDRLDANKDGIVDEAEQKAAIEEATRRLRERMERGYSRMDANRDGRVSREEFLANGDALFDRIDRNRDGRLTAAERQQFFRRRQNAN
jgi:EF-hand domain pair/EF hand